MFVSKSKFAKNIVHPHASQHAIDTALKAAHEEASSDAGSPHETDKHGHPKEHLPKKEGKNAMKRGLVPSLVGLMEAAILIQVCPAKTDAFAKCGDKNGYKADKVI